MAWRAPQIDTRVYLFVLTPGFFLIIAWDWNITVICALGIIICDTIIITEGIELERGFVADEDTTIYNPGLTLLTESEKERLVEGVIDGRKAGLKANQWSDENQYAYDFLVTKLDPLHTVELKGFLGIVPYYGAAIYVAVVAVQQLSRDAFQVAYVLGAAAFFLPIVGLVLAGP